jgi:pyridoxamine 5'-phosphate oxidase
MIAVSQGPEPTASGPAAALAGMRLPYDAPPLNESDLAPDPLTQFWRWLADAINAGLTEPNAMTLATASPDGEPSARTVLLKDVGPRGFTCYSDRGSRKGVDLAANPRASLVFPWLALQRQIVVLGDVEEVSRSEARLYFESRPPESRLAAAASTQSTVLESRAALDAAVAALAAAHPDGAAPMPDRWGGYVVHPTSVEFWQGRPHRLHDRLRYRLANPDRLAAMDDASGWVLERLSP